MLQTSQVVEYPNCCYCVCPKRQVTNVLSNAGGFYKNAHLSDSSAPFRLDGIDHPVSCSKVFG